MARQDFGQFVDGLLREASTYFPALAPITVTRSHQRDSYRVQTRAGDFEFTEEFAPTRRQLVEFLSYQLQQLQRGAEREERRRATHLTVGDRITVNGRETRIVAITEGLVTVEQLDPREIGGRCDCPECRQRQHQQRVDAYDAMRYAMPQSFAPAPITPFAEARAMELLRRHLTPEQTRQWDRDRSIEVRGGHTGARYRIRGEIGAYNIDRIGGGRLCCTPGQPGEVPLGDYVLGQKLALELDEQRFVAAANFARNPGDPGGRVTGADWANLLRDAYTATIGRL